VARILAANDEEFRKLTANELVHAREARHRHRSQLAAAIMEEHTARIDSTERVEKELHSLRESVNEILGILKGSDARQGWISEVRDMGLRLANVERRVTEQETVAKTLADAESRNGNRVLVWVSIIAAASTLIGWLLNGVPTP
jgi:uncharacterized protein (UPF0335 family)